MDEKFEQCSEQSDKTATSSDVATCNQEIPEDLKSKMAEQTDARKAGKTPSSIDLPKMDFIDGNPDAVMNQTKLPVEEFDGDKPVVSSVTDDGGRVVREKFASGPDVVVAYDDKGEPHRFVNEPITKMPPDFDQIPDWRKDQLQKESDTLLEKYAPTDPYTQARTTDFQKVSDMQKEIGQRQDLTETEKCQLYSDIQTTMREKEFKVENWNEKPKMVDSWMGASDPWHAIAPMDDKYHNRLVNMTPEEASKAIFEQEDSTEGDMHPKLRTRLAWKAARTVMGINEGDIQASEGQLKSMRELREKGTFSAYADEWEKQFVKKDGVNPHIGEGGASGTI